MIGDSWETDIEGALGFGMDQIMFMNNGKHYIPDTIYSMRQETNSSCLELKHHIHTYFIDEIPCLLAIL